MPATDCRAGPSPRIWYALRTPATLGSRRPQTMPGSHWMIVMSPENFEITRSRGFDMLGLKSRHRKKAERMAVGDRVLFYVAGLQIFPTTAPVSSTFFEDHTPIWVNTERRSDVAPWRVKLRPDSSLQSYEYLDARQ